MKIVQAVCCAMMLSSLPNITSADEHNLGAREYERSCIQCHGTEGEGDGYFARNLKIAPPDLTSIISRNDGVYPVFDIYKLIMKGAFEGQVHGTGEMPVWGPRYRLETAAALEAEERSNRVAIEREVHERVAALVHYLRGLQKPPPADMDAAFAIIEEDFPLIMMIQPEDVELVVTVPEGFTADGASANLLWIKNGSFLPGSGKFDMRIVAVRDLVGGQRQTSFMFEEDDLETLRKLLGNRSAVSELEKAMRGTESTGTDDILDVEYSFSYSACAENTKPSDETGFSSFHLRDRETSALYYEFELEVPVGQYVDVVCPT